MVLLPMLLLAAVTACDDGLKPAVVALQQNNPGEALALLEPLRSVCAKSSAFYEILGLSNELAGNKAAAEQALRTAVELDDRSSRLLTELGATLLQNGNAADASKVLNQALILDPSNIVTLKYGIGAAVSLQNWHRAAELFGRMNIDTNYGLLQQEPTLTLWLAQALIETKQIDRLDSLLLRERSSMPPALLFSLGTLFAQHQMYERAVDYFKRVPPESADDALYFNLGLSYSHLQKFGEARTAYFEAIDKHPGHVDAYLHVGLDYIASGEPRMGVPWLFRANGLAPARSDISYALADQLISLEYFNTAKELLAQARADDPRDPLLLVGDGDLRRAQGDAGAAAASYRAALAEKPGLAAAYVGLARAEVSAGKESEAKNLLKTALVGDPQNAFVNGELGLLEAHADDWDDALQRLQCAWEQNRSNPEIALELARAYQRKNRSLDALRLLESISPVMQDSPAFHFQLAQLYTVLHRSTDAQAERDIFTTLQTRSQDVLHFENPRTYVH